MSTSKPTRQNADVPAHSVHVNTRRIEVNEDIADAVLWLTRQLENHPYCDAGILISQHAQQIRRVDHTMTLKKMSTDHGGNSNGSKHS